MIFCHQPIRPIRAALLLALVAAACGARTELRLHPLEPCNAAGSVRSCSNTCGTGEQICVEGRWQPCDAVGTRSCTAPCGEGTQDCQNAQWGPCEVPTMRSCSNACGQGQEVCTDGVWNSCDARDERTCTNTCGQGTEVCENGVWSSCDAEGTRVCTNACGEGTQECADAEWSPCDARAVRECETICGEGEQICENGEWGACDGPQPGPPRLPATVRDFDPTHPDFETDNQYAETGIVEPVLGSDDKPVYAGNPTTLSTSGQYWFDQWYHDSEDFNWPTTTIEIVLSPVPGEPNVFTYSNSTFFPIDNQLLGNQGRTHNYHFTLELSTRFRYNGGEVFTFRGDDDLWVFMNDRLALDLGGLHQTSTGTVDLDAQAASLGLEVGGIYTLHLFFAERHTVSSVFSIETTIADWDTCE